MCVGGRDPSSGGDIASQERRETRPLGARTIESLKGVMARSLVSATLVLLALSGVSSAESLGPVGVGACGTGRRQSAEGAGALCATMKGRVGWDAARLRGGGRDDVDLGRADLDEEWDKLQEIMSGMEQYDARASEVHLYAPSCGTVSDASCSFDQGD